MLTEIASVHDEIIKYSESWFVEEKKVINSKRIEMEVCHGRNKSDDYPVLLS
jgi:hypothetical protein